MSLLDILGSDMEDPRTMATLQLAQGLLGGRGNTMQRLAGGLGAYQQTMGEARRAKQAEEERKQLMEQRAMQGRMLEMQLAQQQAAAEEAKRQREADERFRRSIPSPQGQALQTLGADASPTLANAARLPQVDPRSQLLFEALQARQIKPMDYVAATAKDTTPIKLGANERLLDPRSNRVLVDAIPDPAKMSSVAQLMAEMNALPQGDPRRAIYQNAITKATTHQPGTNVTYGAPVAGVDARGNPVFFQPGKDGGAPKVLSGVAPPPQKLAEKQQNQVVGIDAMGQAVDSYVEALGKWKKIDTLNPNRRAEIGTFYNNMMLQAKEAYNLGVLNGPDYAILQDVVRDPLSIMGAVTSNEAMAKQATDLKRIMNKIKAGITKPGSVDAPTGAPKFLGFEPQ